MELKPVDNMEVEQTPIPDVLLLRPRIFGDARGYFMESYSKRTWEAAGLIAEFVQDNESCSAKGVLRGLHFQKPPYVQAKLVRVVRGAVWDVAVDLRRGSPTYGKWYGVELNAEEKWQFLLPQGVAHGFLSLRDDTVLTYKVTKPYAPESEGGLPWNDPGLHIDWPLAAYGIEKPLLSAKDEVYEPFSKFKSPFCY